MSRLTDLNLRIDSGAGRVIIGLVGVGLTATGAVAVFATTNSAGAAALIGGGAVLLVLAVMANRVESIEAAGVKLELSALNILKEAHVAEAAGDHDSAARLQDEARRLLGAASPIADEYERVRASTASSWDRTARLEGIIETSRQAARTDALSKDVVRGLFDRGSDGMRVFALGAMQGDPKLADADAAREALTHPRSAFEQYHALRVAADIVSREPSGPAAYKLGEAAALQLEGGALGSPDSDRVGLAKRILEFVPPPN